MKNAPYKPEVINFVLSKIHATNFEISSEDGNVVRFDFGGLTYRVNYTLKFVEQADKHFLIRNVAADKMSRILFH